MPSGRSPQSSIVFTGANQIPSWEDLHKREALNIALVFSQGYNPSQTDQGKSPFPISEFFCLYSSTNMSFFHMSSAGKHPTCSPTPSSSACGFAFFGRWRNINAVYAAETSVAT